MKTFFSSKTMIALAVAVAAAAAIETEANEQPIPPPATETTLPAGIAPGSPVAQVVKLVQAGVDASVIQIYVSNCPSAFNLDADKIIALTDAGLPSDLVNLMFDHDKKFLDSLSSAAAAPAPPSSPAPVIASSPPPPEPAPAPPAEITVNYFYQTLSPYGSWVEVDGYGRCWRPNIVVYDSNWRPYCDRGRWVYTDCGWYWDSDYSWGVTFQYGRWFNSPRHGWCWWPDTVWAPSWVTWRSSTEYCGWAPLPPYTVYNPGVGFCYRGNNVAVSFDFGLAASCFTFVSVGNFCQPQPRQHCVPPQQVNNFYNSTVVINNFNCKEKNVCNDGVSVTVIGQSARRPIPTVPVHSVNGRRSGTSPFRYFGTDNTDSSQNRQITGTSQTAPAENKDSRENRFNRHPSLPAGNASLATASRQNPAQNWNVISAGNRKPIKLADGNPAIPNAKPDKNSDGRNGHDLIISGRGNHDFARPSPATTSQPTANTSTRSDERSRPIFGQFNRPPAKPATPVVSAPAPVTSPPTPAPIPNNPSKGWAGFNPKPAPAPADNRGNFRPFTAQNTATMDRPQRNDARQNINSSSARNFNPAPAPAPAAPAPNNSGGNARFQSWLAQNR